MTDTGIVLNNGARMPWLGFGTIGQIVENVAFALNHGYDLINTANRYGNETEVGEDLKRLGWKQEEYFLETKLGPTLYEHDHAIDDTLKVAGSDHPAVAYADGAGGGSRQQVKGTYRGKQEYI